MTQDAQTRLFTTTELADRWKITPQAVRNMKKTGRIEGIRTGRQYVFPIAEIEAVEKSGPIKRRRGRPAGSSNA